MMWPFTARKLTDQERKLTDDAERDLEMRKLRGEAVHAEVVHLVERNHLAEKFHEAFSLAKRKS